MLGAGPSQVPLDYHLLLVVNVRIIQRVLEVFPKSVTGLNARVQPYLSTRAMNGRPNTIVASRN